MNEEIEDISIKSTKKNNLNPNEMRPLSTTIHQHKFLVD